MQNEMIPNVASKFNWNKIWHRFGQNSVENWRNTRFSLFLTVYWPKRESDVIWFEFQGQIWNPLIISHLLGPHLIWFSHFYFYLPCYLTTNAGGGIRFFFWKCNFRCVYHDQRYKTHQTEGWDRAFSKICTNWTTLLLTLLSWRTFNRISRKLWPSYVKMLIISRCHPPASSTRYASGILIPLTRQVITLVLSPIETITHNPPAKHVWQPASQGGQLVQLIAGWCVAIAYSPDCASW